MNDFTPDDLGLLSELLRIASTTLREEANRLQSVWPSSSMVERLNQLSEQAEDMRKRVEAHA